MKAADLQDIVIMQDTTTLAFEKLSETFDRENLLEFMHPFFMWQDPEICTHDMVANIATILMAETFGVLAFSNSYLKYTN